MTRSKGIHSLIQILLGAIFACVAAFGILHLMGRSPQQMIESVAADLPIDTSWLALGSSDPVVIGPWPPVKGERYPDLRLSNHKGEQVRLSNFAGKTILLELAAVPCEGCQAFAGGQEYGGFAGVGVQSGLESIHHYAERFGRIRLEENPNVVFVQLLLYGNSMGSPSSEEVAGWAKHFHMDRSDNTLVLRGDDSMLGDASYEMIPGFHLIDEDYVLRYDSAGHHPVDDLYRDLLPALGRMAK